MMVLVFVITYKIAYYRWSSFEWIRSGIMRCCLVLLQQRPIIWFYSIQCIHYIFCYMLCGSVRAPTSLASPISRTSMHFHFRNLPGNNNIYCCVCLTYGLKRAIFYTTYIDIQMFARALYHLYIVRVWIECTLIYYTQHITVERCRAEYLC